LFIWQVIVDRKGKDIAISVDGTYRLLSVKGKTWPVIDGGPCSNYFSGGPGSEYTTTIINVLFLSCLHENEVCYRHYFESMKSLPVVLYNMQPFVPKVVGSDRARAIVNAREHVFPHSRSVLCWIHMDLYRKQGKFAKHMSSTCTIEERARIEADIVALHEMRTQEMFDVAFEFMEGVWANEGGGSGPGTLALARPSALEAEGPGNAHAIADACAEVREDPVDILDPSSERDEVWRELVGRSRSGPRAH
jgi:hypothetical protein